MKQEDRNDMLTALVVLGWFLFIGIIAYIFT